MIFITDNNIVIGTIQRSQVLLHHKNVSHNYDPMHIHMQYACLFRKRKELLSLIMRINILYFICNKNHPHEQQSHYCRHRFLHEINNN